MSHCSVPAPCPSRPHAPSPPTIRDPSTEAGPESADLSQIVCAPDCPGPEYLEEVSGAASHPTPPEQTAPPMTFEPTLRFVSSPTIPPARNGGRPSGSGRRRDRTRAE